MQWMCQVNNRYVHVRVCVRVCVYVCVRTRINMHKQYNGEVSKTDHLYHVD